MGFIGDLYAKYEEAARYVIFGIFTVLVSWGTYALFVKVGIAPEISNALSWFVAVLFAFVMNKYFVFKSVDSSLKKIISEISQFFSARIFTGIVAIILFPVLIAIGLDDYLFGVEGMWARGITSFVEIVLNYILSKYVVFHKKQITKE